MLKSIGFKFQVSSFKFQVQLTAEKGSQFQSSLIDREDSTNRELQKSDSIEVLNKAQAH